MCPHRFEKGWSNVKKLLAMLVIGGLFALGCSPSTPSGKTVKGPGKTEMHEKTGTGSHEKSTEVKDKGDIKEKETTTTHPGTTPPPARDEGKDKTGAGKTGAGAGKDAKDQKDKDKP
jgi:hypothetical protein